MHTATVNGEIIAHTDIHEFYRLLNAALNPARIKRAQEMTRNKSATRGLTAIGRIRINANRRMLDTKMHGKEATTPPLKIHRLIGNHISLILPDGRQANGTLEYDRTDRTYCVAGWWFSRKYATVDNDWQVSVSEIL